MTVITICVKNVPLGVKEYQKCISNQICGLSKKKLNLLNRAPMSQHR
jgi:hypothetical protein